jgi:hypothetical protein
MVLEIKSRNRHNTADLERFLHAVLTEDAELTALLRAAGLAAGAVTARLLRRCGVPPDSPCAPTGPGPTSTTCATTSRTPGSPTSTKHSSDASPGHAPARSGRPSRIICAAASQARPRVRSSTSRQGPGPQPRHSLPRQPQHRRAADLAAARHLLRPPRPARTRSRRHRPTRRAQLVIIEGLRVGTVAGKRSTSSGHIRLALVRVPQAQLRSPVGRTAPMPATLTGPLHGGEQGRAPVSRGSGPWGALRAGDRLRFEERVFTMTGLGTIVRCWMTAAGRAGAVFILDGLRPPPDGRPVRPRRSEVGTGRSPPQATRARHQRRSRHVLVITYRSRTPPPLPGGIRPDGVIPQATR